MKRWVVNPKVLLQVLRESGFLDTSKYVCTYVPIKHNTDERIIMVTEMVR